MKLASFAIIGAGPSGLAAAYELSREGVPAVVFEKDNYVGGLSRTVQHEGYSFDIGGHRFFTKNEKVKNLWHEMLEDDLIRRPRLSRIHHKGKFFHYPLRPINALKGLGYHKSFHVLMSYLYRKMMPHVPEINFEDWASNRFGDALYRLFFKTYTEKVLGIPCNNLSAEWSEQRIPGLNLGHALVDSFNFGKKRIIASLIDEFNYPRLGSGQMYEAMSAKVAAAGIKIILNGEIVSVCHDRDRLSSLIIKGRDGEVKIPVEKVISTMPITDLVLKMQPVSPGPVIAAAKELRYRSIITVNVILDGPAFFPDNWIYLHDPQIKAARMQLYKNWSPCMVPGNESDSISLEYFSFEEDPLWAASDKELLEIAKADLRFLKPSGAHRVKSGFAVRYAKAYPLYTLGYKKHLDTIRQYLDGFCNLACAGRYGQFRYNNMAHSIVTGRMAARRLMGDNVDQWAVDGEEE
jgi:protoporphyrinogen oxidase